jgi:23S rRNA (adenine2030-N6)-methyltransferase
LNYRHSYHAGNIADVFKHYVLTRVLQSLQAKETSFCVIDTHAGSGLYRLEAPGEFENGIGRLWPVRAAWPALADYFAAIERLNPDGCLRVYPGSPCIIRDYLRPQDRAVLLELHPQEAADLKANLGSRTRNIGVHHTDAWSGLKGFVPPKENRGLVLIDPPYEQKDEFDRIVLSLARALKHWRNGIYLAWYPIKGRRPVEQFYAALRGLGAAASAVEFITLPQDVEQRLNGSGLVLINPPWRLQEDLSATLPPLAVFLAGAGGRPEVNFLDLAAI